MPLAVDLSTISLIEKPWNHIYRQRLRNSCASVHVLIQYLTDEECEQMACILYFVRQKTVRPYDDR